MRAETIAERLRGQAETWRGYLPDDTLWDMSDHQFTESVLMAFGLDDMDMPVHEAFDKLADMFDAVAKAAKVDTDMIDRPTCHLIEDQDGRTACSECGCTALYMIDATYCPDCVAVITDD